LLKIVLGFNLPLSIAPQAKSVNIIEQKNQFRRKKKGPYAHLRKGPNSEKNLYGPPRIFARLRLRQTPRLVRRPLWTARRLALRRTRLYSRFIGPRAGPPRAEALYFPSRSAPLQGRPPPRDNPAPILEPQAASANRILVHSRARLANLAQGTKIGAGYSAERI